MKPYSWASRGGHVRHLHNGDSGRPGFLQGLHVRAPAPVGPTPATTLQLLRCSPCRSARIEQCCSGALWPPPRT
jgi:hypothetical protein